MLLAAVLLKFVPVQGTVATTSGACWRKRSDGGYLAPRFGAQYPVQQKFKNKE